MDFPKDGRPTEEMLKDPRVVEAKKKLKETEEKVAEEKRAELEREDKKQEGRDRRVARKMLSKRMRQEAQEIVSGMFKFAFEAKRTSSDYEVRGFMAERDKILADFPDSQERLEVKMFPIFEKALSEELEKRLGKKLPEEVMKAIAMASYLARL